MGWAGLLALFITSVLSRPGQLENGGSGIRVEQGERSLNISWSHPTQDDKNPINGYYIDYLSNTLNRTIKVSQNWTYLTDLEPGTSYTIWITPYSLFENGTETKSSPFGPNEVSTEPLLEVPKILNLTCFPPSSLTIKWYSSYFPRHFHLRYKLVNSTSFDNRTIRAHLNINNQQEMTLDNIELRSGDGVEVSLLSDNIGSEGVRRSPWSPSSTTICPSRGEEGGIGGEETNTSPLLPILLPLFITLLILFILISILFWRKCGGRRYYYLESPPGGLVCSLEPDGECGSKRGRGWEGDDGSSEPIDIHNFPIHVHSLHRDGDIGFSKEYEQLAGGEEDYSSVHSAHPDNKLKNRYLNILAYDHTRVRIESGSGGRKMGDYINGNYIDGFEEGRAYIGTQGPLPSTFDAFWTLVWENRVSVIVMITNLTERGRKKCDQYWPSEGSETYGLVQVRIVKEETMATYILRTFSLKSLKGREKMSIAPKSKKQLVSSEERLLWQFQYTNWPDHGTPSHPLPVLSFVRKSSAANPPDGGPIIVHCSAGVGRTGTYIVLDTMLRQIAKRGDLNIFGFLRHIRKQRNFLVQTEEQYIFCHDALLEAIQSGETNVRLSRLPYYLKCLQERTFMRESGEVISMLQRQYELVSSADSNNYFYLVADKKCNVGKNREGALKPTDHSRVLLIPKPGIEGSDYINASFLPGFSKLREFILTPHPLQGTVSHFWQMLCDHNVSLLVLLSPPNSPQFPPFWPQSSPPSQPSTPNQTTLIESPKSDKIEDGGGGGVIEEGGGVIKGGGGVLELEGGLVVRTIGESESNGVRTTSFALIQSDDDEIHVDMVQSANWPTEGAPSTALFELIESVEERSKEAATLGPIVVVDRYGGTEGATFCTLSTICSQLDSESSLDIYLYAKLYHEQRPGIWGSIDDYVFLYESIDGLTRGKRNSEGYLDRSYPPSPLVPLSKALPLPPSPPPVPHLSPPPLLLHPPHSSPPSTHLMFNISENPLGEGGGETKDGGGTRELIRQDAEEISCSSSLVLSDEKFNVSSAASTPSPTVSPPVEDGFSNGELISFKMSGDDTNESSTKMNQREFEEMKKEKDIDEALKVLLEKPTNGIHYESDEDKNEIFQDFKKAKLSPDEGKIPQIFEFDEIIKAKSPQATDPVDILQIEGSQVAKVITPEVSDLELDKFSNSKTLPQVSNYELSQISLVKTPEFPPPNKLSPVKTPEVSGIDDIFRVKTPEATSPVKELESSEVEEIPPKTEIFHPETPEVLEINEIQSSDVKINEISNPHTPPKIKTPEVSENNEISSNQLEVSNSQQDFKSNSPEIFEIRKSPQEEEFLEICKSPQKEEFLEMSKSPQKEFLEMSKSPEKEEFLFDQDDFVKNLPPPFQLPPPPPVIETLENETEMSLKMSQIVPDEIKIKNGADFDNGFQNNKTSPLVNEVIIDAIIEINGENGKYGGIENGKDKKENLDTEDGLVENYSF